MAVFVFTLCNIVNVTLQWVPEKESCVLWSVSTILATICDTFYIFIFTDYTF